MGKTIPFMLPCVYFDKGRVTLNILNLSAMHPEMTKRAVQAGIGVIEWTPNSPETDAQIYNVSVELVDTKEFTALARRQAALDRLARVVIDEAHLLSAHASFRPIMNLLEFLAGIGVQIVLLTASMPKNMEAELFEMVGVSVFKTVRAPTPRPEIAMKFIAVESKLETHKSVTRLVQKAIKEYGPDDRAIIFCRTVAEAETLSNVIGCPYYTAKMSKADQAVALKKWLDGESKVLVATSILGCCFHYPHVRDVFHAGLPRDCFSYDQECGRGGRDGKRFNATTVYSTNALQDVPSPDKFGAGIIEKTARDVMNCRRILIRTFFDGQADSCGSLPRAELCDICEGQYVHNELRTSGLLPPGERTSCYYILTLIFFLVSSSFSSSTSMTGDPVTPNLRGNPSESHPTPPSSAPASLRSPWTSRPNPSSKTTPFPITPRSDGRTGFGCNLGAITSASRATPALMPPPILVSRAPPPVPARAPPMRARAPPPVPARAPPPVPARGPATPRMMPSEAPPAHPLGPTPATPRMIPSVTPSAQATSRPAPSSSSHAQATSTPPPPYTPAAPNQTMGVRINNHSSNLRHTQANINGKDIDEGLKSLKGHCAVCWQLRRQDQPPHDYPACEGMVATSDDREYRRFFASFDWKKGACFGCGIRCRVSHNTNHIYYLNFFDSTTIIADPTTKRQLFTSFRVQIPVNSPTSFDPSCSSPFPTSRFKRNFLQGV
jgi:hypothetical protein